MTLIIPIKIIQLNYIYIMMLKTFFAIFLFLFTSYSFSKECPDNLELGKNVNTQDFLACSVACTKDSDCILVTNCGDEFIVNKKNKEQFSKYLDQFLLKPCENKFFFINNNGCFKPTCHNNVCLRKSMSCIEQSREIQTPTLDVISNQIYKKQGHQATLINFAFKRKLGERNCSIENIKVESNFNLNSFSIDDPFLKTKLFLTIAKERSKLKQESFEALCYAVAMSEFFKIDSRNENKEVNESNFKDSLKQYYANFLQTSDDYAKGIINSDNVIIFELSDVFSYFSNDYDFLSLLPNKLLLMTYNKRSNKNWSKISFDFYLKYIVLNDPSIPPNSPARWLEDNPQYYKENIIPFFKKLETELTNPRIIPTQLARMFLSRNIVKSNAKEIKNYLSIQGEGVFKCVFAKEVFNYYNDDKSQIIFKELQKSNNSCVREAFKNIDTIKRTFSNGCSDFSINPMLLSNEHIALLKVEKEECSTICQSDADCSMGKKGCNSIYPVNLKFKTEKENDIAISTIKCDVPTIDIPAKAECRLNQCQVRINYCEQHNFEETVRKFIRDSSLDNCSNDSDCDLIVFSFFQSIPQKYPFKKDERYRSMINSFLMESYMRCMEQNESFESPYSARNSSFRSYSRVSCENKKCVQEQSNNP